MECLESITKLYNDIIVDYSAALYCTLPFGNRRSFSSEEFQRNFFQNGTH